LVWLVVVCLGLPAIAWGQGGAAAAPERSGLEAAVAAGDGPAAAAALDALWASDAVLAKESSWRLISSQTVAHRPLGLGAMREHASADDLAAVASALDGQQFPAERRWLVRALGERHDENARTLAAKFLGDRDPFVRAAAVSALADLGDVASVAAYARRLKRVPLEVQSWTSDDDGAEQMAMYGAVLTLTGLSPEAARDVQDWVRAQGDAIGDMTPPPAPDPAEAWAREGDFLLTPSLRVEFDMRDAAAPEEGPSDEAEFVAGLEQSVRAAKVAAEPIFGRVHMPVVRLVFADDHTIGKFGGTSRGYYGFAHGNKIAMRLTKWGSVRLVLAHEYIHLIHSAQGEKQPRWLSEGLAESLTRSARATAWANPLVPGRDEVFGVVAREGLSGVVRWESSGSSGEDPILYAKAHVAVDYLRFGGFGAEDARLALLVGRISRGERPERAVEQVYGRPMRELDEGLKAWLGGLVAEAGPGD
jgi:hypothetical protein